MGRQILAVIVGIVFSFLATAACGYALYQFSDRWSEPQLGTFARYVADPIIAIIVGALVGLLAKSRPAFVAALSLAPWAFAFPLSRRQSLRNEMILLVLSLIYIVVGAMVARIVFRMRARARQVN